MLVQLTRVCSMMIQELVIQMMKICLKKSLEVQGGNKEEIVDSRGAQWDVFHRQDVSKLVEFLRKYSKELNTSS